MDNEKTGFAPVNGAQLYYTINGAAHAETILMIHAGICDSRMWRAQAAYFSQRYRVITFDMRGFGHSKMVNGEYTNHADALGLMNYLEIESAWLMGCSLGGKTALDLTLTAPERVRGLLLVGPAISGYRYAGESHPLEDAIDAAYESGDLERTSEIEVQMWVDGVGRAPDQVDAAARQLVWEMNLIALKVDEALWEQEQVMQPPALERLDSIDKPTLIIIGDLDIPASRERADILAERINGAHQVVMSGAAHVPSMEYPELFNQIVDDFLRDV
jgi:pimeloyl-ACP methyl ester carboxylesterase